MRGFANNSNPSTPAGVGGASPGSNIQHTPATPAEEPNRPAVEALTPPSFTEPPALEPAPELDLNASANESAAEFNSQIPLPTPSIIQASGYGADTGRRSGSMTSGSAKKRKLNDGDEFADLGEGDLDADVAEMLRQDSGTV
jgi:regulator of Ty1 transposition protein 103